MCGIVAIISPTPDPRLEAAAASMIRLLGTRGPDGRRVVTLDRDGPAGPGAHPRVALAHARLRVLDLTDAADQPMPSPDGSQWLVYNGEIYNHIELRARADWGRHTRSTGDTEVLVRLLRDRGRGVLPELDGMFAFVSVDHASGTCLVARDEFGIKPLYWFRDPLTGWLAIASEIKAFTALPGWHAVADPDGVHDYLARGLTDHREGTMFEGVRELRPGHAFELDWDRPEPRPDPWVTLPRFAPDDVASARALFEESVRRRLRSDVPVGSCLSGGVDSSVIVALASAARGDDPIHTITARPGATGVEDEFAFAQRTAEHCGAIAHQVTPTAEGLADELDELVWTQDQPFASASVYAQRVVFREARAQGLVCMLDGQGADEALAGYPAFLPVALYEHARAGRMGSAWRLLAGAPTHLPGTRRAELVARALRGAIPNRIARATRPDSGFMLERIAPGRADPFRSVRAGSIRGLSIDMLRRSSLPMLLRYEDRNSMAFSVEARLPYLSPGLVAWSLARDAHELVRGGELKAPLRDAARELLPNAVTAPRPKVAYKMPDDLWLRNPGMRAHRERALGVLGGWLSDDLRSSIRAGGGAAVWRAVCFSAWADRFGVSLGS